MPDNQKTSIRSKDMPSKNIIVLITGMECAEKEAMARKIQETIRRENRLRETENMEKISYQIS